MPSTGSNSRPPSPAASPEPQTRRAPARLRHPFETLRHEIDRFIHAFDQAFAAPTLENVFSAHWPKPALSMVDPPVDILETTDGYELRAELPGVGHDDIALTVSGGLVHLRGEKTERSADPAQTYFLHERHFGSFERSFRLPDGVDEGNIRAWFKDGVLTVAMPRSPRPEPAPRKIPIATV